MVAVLPDLHYLPLDWKSPTPFRETPRGIRNICRFPVPQQSWE